MSEYTATYSPEDNKLRLYASGRLGDELYKRVRAAGFIWAPKQDLFVAPMWTPDREDLLIELAGEIGDEDTSLAERAEERADRFVDYQEKRADDSTRAHAAVSAIADGIPLGQPILVGHHSERHARKDAERIETGMRKAIKMWETSEYWKRRAAGALRHAKYKELPRVRANRIKTIETDKRRQERQIAQSRMIVGLWAKLDQPGRGEELRPGVYAMSDEAPSDALRLKRAQFITGSTAAGHGYMVAEYARPSGYTGPLTFYDACRTTDEQPAPLFPIEEVRAASVASHERIIARCERWIAHCTNRLIYERAMLEEQGASDLLKPKAKPVQLPLVNYRAEGGSITCPNIYSRGEMVTYPQVDMTAKEYADINRDYKGTRVVGHSHRIRTCLDHRTRDHRLVCVFLTDSKVHPRPADIEPTPPAPRAPRPTYTRPEPSAQETAIESLKASLEAGVQVVSAPQLFPTPPAVAARLVDIAEIAPGMRVLEPSAGTGAIIDAIPEGVHVVAVEINNALCRRLNTLPKVTTTIEADFLDMAGVTPDATFDRIVMNPPFTMGSDIKHIEHARRMLAPGGLLVAICGGGPRQREKYNDYIVDELPPGTFEGTNVTSLILRIEAEP